MTETTQGARAPWRARLLRGVESAWFTGVVTAAVLANAIVLGVDVHRDLPDGVARAAGLLNLGFVAFFVVEIALKLVAYGGGFFRDGWRAFDFTIVAISVFPAAGPFAILRALRVLRIMRLVSVFKPLRRVVEALVRAIPQIAAILGLLAVIFYIGGVFTTAMFGGDHDRLFGTLGDSVTTLFQVMLFDGWADDVVREVEATHAGATVFFIAFTVLTGFAVLNLFIAVMVDSLRTEHDRLQSEHDRLQDEDIKSLEQRQARTATGLDAVEAAVGALDAKIERLLVLMEEERAQSDQRDGRSET